jgi:hypothetical protein
MRDDTLRVRAFFPTRSVGRHWLIPVPRRCGACGARSQASHSGGAGAPPGAIMGPCQELADDLRRASYAMTMHVPTGLRRKRGPAIA